MSGLLKYLSGMTYLFNSYFTNIIVAYSAISRNSSQAYQAAKKIVSCALEFTCWKHVRKGPIFLNINPIFCV